MDEFRPTLARVASQCSKAGADAVEQALAECSSGQTEWLDATTTMQLLVLDGRIWIREGRDKSLLSGLADLHPGGTNQLYVLYRWQDQFYEALGAIRQAHACVDRVASKICVCNSASRERFTQSFMGMCVCSRWR